MPKGKYTAADVAPDNGSMPNAGPMGKYSAADVADAPPVEDDDPISRFFQGAGNRVTGMTKGIGQAAITPFGLPRGIIQSHVDAYKSAKEAGERGDTAESMVKSVAAGLPVLGPGAVSIYDKAKSGDTAGALGAGGVDALAMLLPTEGAKGAGVAADVMEHPVVQGTGRVIRDFDITKPFKSIGDNVVGPAMDKLGQMRAARGKPTLQSPLDPSAGVSVQGGGVEQPRIPSPAEDMLNSLDNESAVRRAPNKGGRPPARVPSPAESVQSPLEPGTGTVAPRQFGDAPVSADASRVPTLADEIVGPLEQGEGTVAPRSMQPTADMNTGGGGANYSADDLANLISKHNIPPAPGEIVGGTPTEPTPQIKSRWWHGTNTDALPGIAEHGLTRVEFGEGDFGPGPFLTDNASVAKDYALQDPNSGAGRVLLGVDVPVGETRVAEPTVRPFTGGDEDFIANELDAQRTIHPSEISEVRHLQRTGYPEVSDDAGILQAMREDLDAHGRNALHEESTDFAARNKVGKGKTDAPGYGWHRRLPELDAILGPEFGNQLADNMREAQKLGVDPDSFLRPASPEFLKDIEEFKAVHGRMPTPEEFQQYRANRNKEPN